MNITLGVPRIKEIINAAKKISSPIITVPLITDNDVKAARIVKARIEKTTLGEIAEYIEQVFKPVECYIDVKLDSKAIDALQLNVNVESVINSIMSTKKLKMNKKCHIFTAASDLVRICAKEEFDNDNLMFDLQRIKSQLSNVVVAGVDNVNRAVINDTGGGKLNLLVEGYNLLQCMGVVGVKSSEVTSNHVDEMLRVLGIEAARSTIIHEIHEVMKGHGLVIDNRHVSLLADIMSYRGSILGITRFGIAKMKESVLMLASFEKTADHLYEAALRGSKDQISGVSECIIMGREMKVGTGMFDLIQKIDSQQMKFEKGDGWDSKQLLLGTGKQMKLKT